MAHERDTLSSRMSEIVYFGGKAVKTTFFSGEDLTSYILRSTDLSPAQKVYFKGHPAPMGPHVPVARWQNGQRLDRGSEHGKVFDKNFRFQVAAPSAAR